MNLLVSKPTIYIYLISIDSKKIIICHNLNMSKNTTFVPLTKVRPFKTSWRVQVALWRRYIHHGFSRPICNFAFQTFVTFKYTLLLLVSNSLGLYTNLFMFQIRSSSDIIHRCESNKSEPSILLLRFALLLVSSYILLCVRSLSETQIYKPLAPCI